MDLNAATNAATNAAINAVTFEVILSCLSHRIYDRG